MLVEDPQLLWLSQTGLPQTFTIECIDAQSPLRTFGWYCWHAYTSNPAEIRLDISEDGVRFEQVHVSFEGAKEAGLHFRGLEPAIDLRKYKYLRFRFPKTYGADRVYLNRLYLFREPIEQVKVYMERMIRHPLLTHDNDKKKEKKTPKKEKKSNVRHDRDDDDDRWPLSVTTPELKSHRSDPHPTKEKDEENIKDISVEKLRAQIQEMETLVSRCVNSSSPLSSHVSTSSSQENDEKKKKPIVTIPMTPPQRVDPEATRKMEMCMSSIDKIERRVKRLSEALGSVVSQVHRIRTPIKEKKNVEEEEKETLTPTSVKQQLESMLQNVLTAWASQLLKVQSESMQRRLDHRLKLERQGMIQELMKAQHEFTEKWSKKQNGKFEALVRDTIVKAAAEKRKNRMSGSSSNIRRRKDDEERLNNLVTRRARELAKIAAKSVVPLRSREEDEDEIRSEIEKIVRPYHPEKWVPASSSSQRVKRKKKNAEKTISSYEQRLARKMDAALAQMKKSNRKKPFR
jgi:hypothetical protein